MTDRNTSVNTGDESTENQHSFDSSDLLNSSFFSSESVNVLDHSKSFRNSIILREMSDFNLNDTLNNNKNNTTSINEPNIQSSTDSTKVAQPEQKKNPNFGMKAKSNEIKTVNMTTSPSLSALADLLNEKSKNADRKMQNNMQFESSIITEEEEDEEHDNNIQQNASFSPNLIDLNDDNTVMNIKNPVSNLINERLAKVNEQPDFLSSPHINGRENSDSIQKEIVKQLEDPTESDINDTSISEIKANNNNNNSNNNNNNNNNNETSPNTIISNENSKNIINEITEPVFQIDDESDEDKATLIGEPINNNRLINNSSTYSRRINNQSVSTSQSLLGAGSNVPRTQSIQPDKPKKISRIPKSKDKIKDGNANSQDNKQKKRRSFFSFLKKKPIKPKDFSVTHDEHSNAKPPSSNKNKRSVSSQSHINSDDISAKIKPLNKGRSSSVSILDNQPGKLEKKSRSSNSIFSNFKKNNSSTGNITKVNSNELSKPIEKSFTPTKKDEPLVIPKIRSELDNDKKHKNSPIKNEDTRKSTPLHFEHALNTDITINLPVPKNDKEEETSKSPSLEPAKISSPHLNSPQISFHESRRDSGEVHFPKVLDEQEIDQITQIERNRSIRSSIHKKSVDTLSIKAQNDGMTVFEPSEVRLSTPDLSKSPTSSILKNIGRFENDDDDDDNYELDHIADNHDNSDPDFKFNSIEQKLNELTFDYDNSDDNLDISNYINDKSNLMETPTKNNKRLNDDHDLMNDIMEFANIIDFGEGVNFDVDAEQTLDEYPPNKTFNPSFQDTPQLDQDEFNLSLPRNQIINGMENENVEANTGLGLEFSTANDVADITHEVKELTTPMVDENEFMQDEFKDEPFDDDNEYHNQGNSRNDMADVEEQDNYGNEPNYQISSPHMDEHIAHNYDTTPSSRPISMSFRGLMGPTLNNPSPSTINTESNPNQKIQFSSKIILYETYDEFEYDRHPDISTCNQLTPQLAQMIKVELNELKAEMEVHEESRCYTQFF